MIKAQRAPPPPCWSSSRFSSCSASSNTAEEYGSGTTAPAMGGGRGKENRFPRHIAQRLQKPSTAFGFCSSAAKLIRCAVSCRSSSALPGACKKVFSSRSAPRLARGTSARRSVRTAGWPGAAQTPSARAATRRLGLGLGLGVGLGLGLGSRGHSPAASLSKAPLNDANRPFA